MDDRNGNKSVRVESRRRGGHGWGINILGRWLWPKIVIILHSARREVKVVLLQ